MSRPIASLPLGTEMRGKLIGAGFHTCADFSGLGPVALAKEVGIDHADALEVLRTVTTGGVDPPAGAAATTAALEGENALAMLTRMQTTPRIILFCKAMDRMLGGGVSVGELTEFCGVPGIGKTQVGIQLAIDVQIPRIFEGAEGEAVYIDTEGSFMVDRAAEMATAMSTHLRRMTEGGSEEEKAAAAGFSLEAVLSRIHYFRVYDYVEQLALLQVLPEFLAQHPRVRLVVVDSITFQVRYGFKDMAHRTRLVNGMAQQLLAMASAHQVAVVVMNQVTTRVTSQRNAYLAPALGESWSHVSTSRVLLFWKNGQRWARLAKHPSMKATTVPYTLEAAGVRGVRRKRPRDSSPATTPSPSSSSATPPTPPTTT